ncbi:MAG TPA: hypothetical protein PLW99_02820, partial [Candidatus Paceibacterota bacterium]|nr:hypothetical protein [Candidatus Paceibacterota bacterium]
TVSFGMALSALGLYLLMHLDPTMTSLDFVLPLVLFGAGLGLGMAPLTNAATTAVPLHEVGMSSGLLNLTRNIGGAFGIAIFSTILVNATNANVLSVAQHSHILGTTPTILAEAQALIILKADLLAYGTVFGYAAAAMFIGGLIALFFLRTTNTDEKAIPPELLAEAAAGG